LLEIESRLRKQAREVRLPLCIGTKKSNNDLINRTERGLKDCFQADRKSKRKDFPGAAG
jgi:hypothetical protein